MICWRCKRKFGNRSAQLDLCKPCSEDCHQLTELAQEIEKCTACPLSEGATKKVYGRGFWAAPILFIGEAPGKKEDEEGFPFVGAAGVILDTLIDYVDLPKDSYFITNVVCCRPPNNRVPLPAEIKACEPFLKRAITYIKPKIIVTLGATATRDVFKIYKGEFTEKPMSEMHGQIQYLNDFKLLPMYHPAAILYNGTLMDRVKDDFKLLKILYRGIK